MGNNQTSSSNQNQNLNHLTENQENQNKLKQLFDANKTVNRVAYYNAFGYGYPGSSQHRDPITIKKSKVDVFPFSLHTKTVQLEKIQDQNLSYNLQFKFTTQIQCTITIYFEAREILDLKQQTTKDIKIQNKNNKKVYKFDNNNGETQQFNDKNLIFDLSELNICEICKNGEDDMHGIIIKIENNTNDKKKQQILYNYCELQTYSEIIHISIGKIKQKLENNGKSYQLSQVYGNQMEKKQINNELQYTQAQKECSICLTDQVNSIIMPCKHMCLCYDCCQSLRTKANKCPICRSQIESFIKMDIKSLKNINKNIQEN